ncbi:LacI family DNA-binding transcriptional regulator [Duganella hordei]|uniref:LacI family DNA-binding transcriptional regulator n=1 Tax=Duganella hordei TaxID=2865934 RepID=UPI0030E9075D
MTLDQLALNLGLSKGTVSRAMNGKGRMAEETRKRILAAMDEAGYTPDPTAQELSKRSRHSIGISLSAGAIRPYFALFWRALVQVTSERGTRFIEMNEPLDSYARLPDAVLLHSTIEVHERLALLARRGVPAVVLGHQPDTAFVVPDDVYGGRVATAHLLALGHREIAYVGGPGGQQSDLDRRAGYREAMAAAGIRPRPQFELEGRFEVLDGYRCVRRAWEGGLRFTALFCASDDMAVGAIGALHDLGLRVPADVSVVGFDGLPGMPYDLSTVVQDIERVAMEAIDLAEILIDGGHKRGIVVPVALREGSTTAPPRRL